MQRPGTGLIGVGILILVLNVLGPLWAIGEVPLPKWLLFEAVSWGVSTALVLWGWSRLRRAKATYPDLSWRQFLHDDLIGLGIFGALMVVLLAMPRVWLEGLTQWLHEIMHQLHLLHVNK
jgi:hypothetical protein